MKLSFFKLPCYIVLFYCLFDFILYNFAFIDGSNIETETLMTLERADLFFKFFIYYNYYQLPYILLVFIVSAVSLHRFSVHQINKNNILYSLIIALLIAVSINCFQVYLVNDLYISLIDNIEVFYNDFYVHSFENYVILLLFKLIIYIAISLIIYFIIKILSPFYTHTANFLTAQNSPNVHLSLFIALFNLIYFTMTFSLTGDYDYRSLLNIDRDDITIYITILIVLNILCFLAVHKLFTNVADKLRIMFLISCAIITFILLIIANILLVIFSINNLSSFYDDYALSLIVHIILFCLVDFLVLRICVKFFFSKKRDATTLTAKSS